MPVADPTYWQHRDEDCSAGLDLSSRSTAARLQAECQPYSNFVIVQRI